MSEAFLLPPGAYYIGDPCYVIGKDDRFDWHKVLDETCFFEKSLTREDGTAIAFNTAHGDGEFRDGKGFRYCVDSGMIGAVPLHWVPAEVVAKWNTEQRYGRIIDVREKFECRREGGVLIFGTVKINTDK